jgi:endoglucanase
MDIDFLKKLVTTPSPSGFEQPVQELVRGKFEGSVDELKTDVHGNVIGIRNPEGKPRIMLAAHSDEIGFMVKHITDEGYIYFAPVGGVDVNLIPGQSVEIYTKKGVVPGVVGKKPIHLMEDEDKKKKQEIYNLWIDIGAGKKERVEKIVSIGDPVTFSGKFNTLQNKRLAARSFDDKAGVFVLTEVMEKLRGKKFSAAVFSVATVQEELGLRGARTSAYAIEPDVGIAIDVEFSSDYPEIDKKRVGEISLGKGPVLSRGANINPVLGEFLIQTAKEKKIPYQLLGSPKATGTDANVMQLTRSGVATAVIGIPNRYMHTPVEVISTIDLENAVKLLASFILKIKKNMDFIPTRVY